nr:hypothetical protein [Tanacetum cinerariifolium]
MSKNNTKARICTLSKNDLKDLMKTYRILLDLHPRLPDPRFIMDRLPADVIGIYYHRAVLDYLTCIHSCSCVSDDLPFDGYDQNDVQQLRARLIHLHEMREEMSIYAFMTLPSWSDAKIVEESYHLSLPLLECVIANTTAPATEGSMVPLPISDEIASSLPKPHLAKKSKGPVQARVRLDLKAVAEPSRT